MIFASRHHKKNHLVVSWQVLTLGKYNLRSATTHDILHCVIIYLTKIKPEFRSHVCDKRSTPYGSVTLL